MTENEWLTSRDPGAMLSVARQEGSERKLRLFACGCCRQLGALLKANRDRSAVELGEWLADHEPVQVAVERLRRTIDWRTPGAAKYAVHWDAATAAVAAQQVVCDTLTEVAWREAVRQALDTAGVTFAEMWEAGQKAYATVPVETRQAGRRIHSDLLRCIFGNPFRPVAVDPCWRTETVVALAHGIYEERAFDRLPILADALEDAGCDSRDLLDHCRGPGPHARGCWVIDLLLAKV